MRRVASRLVVAVSVGLAGLALSEVIGEVPIATSLNLPTAPSWLPLGEEIPGLAAGESFGANVVMNADATVLAVGAPDSVAGGAGSGQVRVFAWDGTNWQVRGTFTGVTGEALGSEVELSADGDTLAIAGPQFAGAVGRVQVHHWDGVSWSQRGSDLVGGAGDELGAVGLSGNGEILVVGGRNDSTLANQAGSVTVYEWDGTTWVMNHTPLRGGGPGDRFGARVAITPDGFTLAVSATGATTSAVNAGAVQVYDDVNGVWQARGAPLEGVGRDEWFGSSLAISDDGMVVAAGSRFADRTLTDEGVAEVYAWDGSAWTPRGATFTGGAAVDMVGADLELSGDGLTLAVASPGVANGAAVLAGTAEVYDWNPGTATWDLRSWAIQGIATFDLLTYVSLSADGATLATARIGADASRGAVEVVTTARLASWGSGFSGAALFGRSGSAMALDDDGDTLVIGAPGLAAASLEPGTVEVHRRSGSTWAPVGAPIVASGVDDLFGVAVDVDAAGDTIVVGAPQETGAVSDAGRVRVYDFDGTTWQLRGSPFEGSEVGQGYGAAVAIDRSGTVIAIGAPGTDVGALADAGQVEVYSWNGSAWTARPVSSGSAAGDLFGYSVALDADGDVVAAGAALASPGGRLLAGSVVVTTWNGAAWSAATPIEGAAAGDRLGSTVALDATGDVVATGSPGYEVAFIIIAPPAAVADPELGPAARPVVPLFGADTGRVLVHRRAGASWSQIGQTLYGATGSTEFGARVALDDTGTLLVVGAPRHDDLTAGANSGQTVVYRLAGAAWRAVGEPLIGLGVGVEAGTAVAVAGDGRVVAVGAPLTNGVGVENGAVDLVRIDRRATPPSPRPLTATPSGSDALVVTWTRGPVDPSDAILTSTIEVSPDGGRSWAVASWTTLDAAGTTITGLDSARTYLVRVADVNASGIGAWAVTAATTLPAAVNSIPPPPSASDPLAVTVVSGADPIALAAAVSRTVRPEGVDLAYVATVTNFPDAATGGAVGGSGAAPVLLTRRDDLPAATADELVRLGVSRVVIVGGVDVISTSVATAIADLGISEVERLGGPDRYQTAAAVARHRDPEGVDTVVIVNGVRHGDAVIAGPLAAAADAPVLLSGPRSLPAATLDVLDALDPRRILVVGGSRAVANSVLEDLAATGAVVERIAGADRVDTAGLLAARLDVTSGGDVIMVDRDREGDALVVGAAAIHLGAPVLYVSGGCLATSTLDAIESLAPRRMVLVATDARRDETLAALQRPCDTGP